MFTSGLYADLGLREVCIEYIVFATLGTNLNFTEKNPITKVFQIISNHKKANKIIFTMNQLWWLISVLA